MAPWFQAVPVGYGEGETCDGISVAPIDARITTYQAALSSAVKALGGPNVFAFLQGLVPDGVEYDLGVLQTQIESAVGIVKGVGLFDMANGLQLLDTHQGVFAD